MSRPEPGEIPTAGRVGLEALARLIAQSISGAEGALDLGLDAEDD
ncbi:MAG: hypothetical protein AB1778_08570 [Candidatus Bipolaricaulota bacterium]